MIRYLITDNELVHFTLDVDMDDSEMEIMFKKYLYPYLNYKTTENIDYNHFVISTLSPSDDPRLKEYNNYYYLNNVIYIGKQNDCLKAMKRIILDIYSRLLEQGNGIFLHASAISYNDGALIFLGDRGAGKTYNLLNFLINNNGKFMSNDKVFLYKKGNEYYAKGFPSAIGIRKKTILQNPNLKKYFPSVELNDEIYLEKDNTTEKENFNLDDFCKLFNIQISSTQKVRRIIVLNYSSDNDVHMNIIDREKRKKYIIDYSISGVYDEQKFLEEIIPVTSLSSFTDYSELPICEFFQVRGSYRKNNTKILKLMGEKR